MLKFLNKICLTFKTQLCVCKFHINNSELKPKYWVSQARWPSWALYGGTTRPYSPGYGLDGPVLFSSSLQRASIIIIDLLSSY